MWAITFAAALVAVGLMSLPARASAATCRRVQAPNAGTGDNQLRGVAIVSSRNAWAVGYSTKTPTSLAAALIEHWNGKAWRIQPSPIPQALKHRYTQLLGVAAISSGNAWAVGYAGTDGLYTTRAVIEHWNGRAWKRQAGAIAGFSELFAVAATSATDVWAVGEDRAGALIEHWNGRVWKRRASPRLRGGELLGVTATSPRNAWAVGYGQFGARTLIEHWNGRRWTVQASPTVQVPPYQVGDVTLRGAQLSGVAATSSANAWAVGYAYTFGHGSGDEETEMVIEHWNGRAWRVQAGADQGAALGSLDQLFGVAATSPRNAWTVGSSLTGAEIQRRRGGHWIAQASPAGELFSVAIAPSSDVWAVGAYYNYATPGFRTLAVHCH